MHTQDKCPILDGTHPSWFIIVFQDVNCNNQMWSRDELDGGEVYYGCSDEGGYSGPLDEVTEGLEYDTSHGFEDIGLTVITYLVPDRDDERPPADWDITHQRPED